MLRGCRWCNDVFSTLVILCQAIHGECRRVKGSRSFVLYTQRNPKKFLHVKQIPIFIRRRVYVIVARSRLCRVSFVEGGPYIGEGTSKLLGSAAPRLEAGSQCLSFREASLADLDFTGPHRIAGFLTFLLCQIDF